MVIATQRKYKLLKTVSAAACASAVLIGSAFGGVISADDDSSDTVTVFGQLECGHLAEIGIRIYAPEKTSADLSAAAGDDSEKILGIMPYQNQGYSEENGRYSVTAEIVDGKSGEYTVYVGCSECGEVDRQTVLYSNVEEAKNAFVLLKNAISENDRAKTDDIYKNHKYALGFVSKTDGMSTEENRIAFLHSYLSNGVIDKCDYANVRYIYGRAALAAARTKIADILDYADECALDGTEIGKFLTEKFVNDKLKSDMTYRFAKCSASEMEDMDGFLKCLKDSFILAVVRYPDGTANLKKVLSEVKSYIGYETLSSDCVVYLSGRNIDSIEKLRYEISSYKSNGGSGSGGGSGGGSGFSGLSNRFTSDSPLAEDKPQTIDENIFDDIDDVSWAKESIINLAQLKIINGKGDYKFCPNDSITREETVKIIVCAFLPDAEQANTTFSDVNDDEWYTPYIEKAFGEGIIRGVSTDAFGIGSFITRQDMAVLCGNIYKYINGSTMQTEDGSLDKFSDDNDISDYAKDSVYLLKKLGIINGTDNGKFQPNSDITRAEAAKMIYGLYEYLS